MPSHIEEHLQTEWGNDLLRRAVEALAAEGYHTGVFSLGEVAEMLDFSINNADGFLKEHGILAFENIEEIDSFNF